VVATVTNDADAYAQEVAQTLEAAGLRAVADTGADKISYKVRQHSLAKVPLLFAVGAREMAERTVSLRRLGSQEQRELGLAEAAAACAAEAMPPDLRA
jgi:threonyl-tRNA synthetase